MLIFLHKQRFLLSLKWKELLARADILKVFMLTAVIILEPLQEKMAQGQGRVETLAQEWWSFVPFDAEEVGMSYKAQHIFLLIYQRLNI